MSNVNEPAAPDNALGEEQAWQSALQDVDNRLAAELGEPAPELLDSLCAQIPPLAPWTVLRRRRVLVVDDEPSLRRLVEHHLTEVGYEVQVAEDGHGLLELALAWRPDLLVLDVHMPGPNGLQLLEILKQHPVGNRLPVLMLTAQNTDDAIRRGWRTGVDFWMTKPFNPLELRAVVDRMLAVAGTPEEPPPPGRLAK